MFVPLATIVLPDLLSVLLANAGEPHFVAFVMKVGSCDPTHAICVSICVCVCACVLVCLLGGVEGGGLGLG